MDTANDIDRDAAAAHCRAHHDVQLLAIHCDQCQARAGEILCLECGRHERDGETVDSGDPDCEHDVCVDGFGTTVPSYPARHRAPESVSA